MPIIKQFIASPRICYGICTGLMLLTIMFSLDAVPTSEKFAEFLAHLSASVFSGAANLVLSITVEQIAVGLAYLGFGLIGFSMVNLASKVAYNFTIREAVRINPSAVASINPIILRIVFFSMIVQWVFILRLEYMGQVGVSVPLFGATLIACWACLLRHLILPGKYFSAELIDVAAITFNVISGTFVCVLLYSVGSRISASGQTAGHFIQQLVPTFPVDLLRAVGIVYQSL